MYDKYSMKATEFIDDQEIQDSIAWAEENKDRTQGRGTGDTILSCCPEHLAGALPLCCSTHLDIFRRLRSSALAF